MVPRGPHASPQQAVHIQKWWLAEIEPYKALILGVHEAILLDAMSTLDRWYYHKYRYDIQGYWICTHKRQFNGS